MQAIPRPCEVCGGSGFTAMFDKEEHHFVRCDACGLERIDPQPTDDTLAKIYGKHYYDAWGLHRDENTVATMKKATFSFVLDKLPKTGSNTKLLDCGAATGFLLDVAKERGFDPYGIELSEFGANEIGKKLGADHVFRGQIEDASFPHAKPGDFQVVTMCDYLEHVRDPKRVLEKAKDLLAPRGIVALTTPDTTSLTHRVLAKGWSHYKIEHLYYFGRKNLTKLLESAGFENVTFRPLLKALNIKYIREQFEVYPHPVLSRVARGLGKTLPGPVQAKMLRFMTGEMLAIAEKR